MICCVVHLLVVANIRLVNVCTAYRVLDRSKGFPCGSALALCPEGKFQECNVKNCDRYAALLPVVPQVLIISCLILQTVVGPPVHPFGLISIPAADPRPSLV